MAIEIGEGKVKEGIMGLVLALVEIIGEVLKHQAVRRMEGGSLTDAEIERLGSVLREFERTIEEIKEDYGSVEAVRSIKAGLDEVVDGIIGNINLAEEKPRLLS